MRFRKSPAFILKTFPYSDTSLIVHALTPGEGRVHLLAKGARRGSARGMQALEPFCRAELMWVEKEGRELQTLRESTLLEGNGAWRGDLARWAMGCLVFELADRAVTAGERHGALFDLLRAAAAEAARLDAPSQSSRAAKNDPHFALAALLPFGYGVLRSQGLAPQVARCVRCGATQPPFPAIDLRQGGVLCARCAGGSSAFSSAPPDLSDPADVVEFSGPRWPLDEGVRRILADWLLKWRPAADAAAPAAPHVRLSARQARALLGLLDRLAAEHLDAPLKSLPLVTKLCF